MKLLPTCMSMLHACSVLIESESNLLGLKAWATTEFYSDLNIY